MNKVTPRLLEALKDCASFRSSTYIWKRKTMQKAVSLGLAEEVRHSDHTVRFTAFVLTEAGRAALAEKDA